MNIRLPAFALFASCLAASAAMATSSKLHPMVCSGMSIPIYGFALDQSFLTSVPGTKAAGNPGTITVEVAISDLPSVLGYFAKDISSCKIDDSITLAMTHPRLVSFSASSNFEDTATTSTAYATLSIYYTNAELGAGVGALSQTPVGGWNRVNNVSDLSISTPSAN